MRKFIKILLLLIIPVLVNAQQGNPDSLKRELIHATTDSARWVICWNLSFYYGEKYRDSGLYYAETGLHLARQNNKHLNEAALLDFKGYELIRLGQLPESYQCLTQALKIAENANSEHSLWLYFPVLNNFTTLTPRKLKLNGLMNIHNDFGHLMGVIAKTDQQIAQYKQAQKIAEENKDSIFLGIISQELAEAYFGLGKLDSTLLLEENAVRIFIQTGDKIYLSNSYGTLGDLYLKKHEKATAVQYFHIAVQSAIEQDNYFALALVYNSLTHFYLSEEKNKDSSLYYARQNLSILKVMGSKDLGKAYSNLSASYDLNNKIDSAYKYKSLALVSIDSSNAALIESLTKVQNLKFDEQLKLQELEKEKADTRNRNRTFGLLAGLGVFVIVAFILYRNNKQKQKSNQLLRQQKEKVESTLTELKSTQAQLIQSEKMASLGELTAGIAHEIQNPLNFVNNFSEVNTELIEEADQEIDKGNISEVKIILNDIKENEQKINHHGKRADAIVKGMLQHSRSSTGVKEPTDINALADEYLRLAYHGLRAKDKEFNAIMKTDFDETIGKINIIPQDIGRVLLNLYNNAFYAVSEKKKQQLEYYEPSVSVATKKINNKAEITVKDNGNGIPQKVVDKIFQPFFTTKPTGEGTGLGLSLSYDITKAHGGEIKVNTIEGEFTEFVIQLPVSV